jgi:phosphate transport system permease protein
MPIQMFNWTSRPQAEFLEIAAAAGLVLLIITLLMNGTAIWLRYRLRQAIKW